MARAKRKQLTPAQLKAIALLIAQDVNGMTKEEIAEEVGVSSVTLWKWRNTKLFNDELVKQGEELQRSFLTEAYTNLRQIMSSKTARDSTKLKAIELVLKNQGRLTDVQEQTITVEERSVEEMLKEIEEL